MFFVILPTRTYLIPMRKILYAFGLIVMAVAFSSSRPAADTAQEKRLALFGIAFYNQENLFDTIHAPGKNDYDFLPDGSYKWTGMKYQSKLKNMSRVLSELCTEHGLKSGAAVIGLSEVENRTVVEDLTHQPSLANRHYRVLHFDSPDRRGIDCAMLYNPRMFQLEDSLYVPYIYPSDENPADEFGFSFDDNNRVVARPLFGDTTHITRGFLVGIGRMAGDRLAVIVNHWPSRGAESVVRERAGRQVFALCQALQKQYGSQLKIVVMGDLNDDPDNLSLTQGMQCKFEAKKITGPGDFFNPWFYTLRKQGQGTLRYNGRWNLFDQILLSGNMVNTDYNLKSPQKPSQLDRSQGLTFWRHSIFMRDYLFQQEGKYKGNPLRTTAGGVWLNGYSDHLPTQIYLIKDL